LVDLIKEGETIIVRNCKVPVVNGHMRMQVDAFGKIEVSNDVKINEVKLDKDFSSVEYDHFSSMSRYTGNRDRSQYSQSDNQSMGTFLSQIGR
jgi:hypothetical protein